MQLIFKFAKTLVMPRGEGEGGEEKTLLQREYANAIGGGGFSAAIVNPKKNLQLFLYRLPINAAVFFFDFSLINFE